MKTGIGLPVFPGVSIGPAVVYRKSERTLPVSSGDPAIEQAEFDAAVVTAAIEDGAAAAIAALDTGEEFAAVFAAMDDEYMNARPAGMLVKTVAPFTSKVTIEAPTGKADARRLMALMKLAANL